MSATVFVDTNVLVYFRDAADPIKQRRAQDWMASLWQQHCGRLSFQVLQEYYVTVTQKLDPGLPVEQARDDVRALLAWKPVATNANLIEKAWDLHDRFHVSWWDSLIVAAARSAGCLYLLTEDLQSGQGMGGGVVLDPFRSKYADLG